MHGDLPHSSLLNSGQKWFFSEGLLLDCRRYLPTTWADRGREITVWQGNYQRLVQTWRILVNLVVDSCHTRWTFSPSFPSRPACLVHQFPGRPAYLVHQFPGRPAYLVHQFPGRPACLVHQFPGGPACLAHQFPGRPAYLVHQFPGRPARIVHQFPGGPACLVHRRFLVDQPA
jgi:hypothetical protein